MAEPCVGEIRMFAGNFAPVGWAMCQGQLLPISENEELFTLIGTTYGGDGQRTFALPDLRGRVPLHQGSNPQSGTSYALGQQGGTETVTLNRQQIPSHNHGFAVTTAVGTQANPGGNIMARSQGPHPYIHEPPGAGLNTQTIGGAGNDQPHNNLQPLVCINFIISLFGAFPSSTVGQPMSDPFLAEIRIFPFAFAPRGWAFCNGQQLSISQNTALFSLLGTTYGGDGRSTFALPNLQGSVPVGAGQGRGLSAYVLGESCGSDTVTLVQSEMPYHNHQVMVHTVDQGDNRTPHRSLSLGNTQIYQNSANPNAQFNFIAITPSGGSLPHNNLMPYMTFNFCIALQGSHPPRPPEAPRGLTMHDQA